MEPNTGENTLVKVGGGPPGSRSGDRIGRPTLWRRVAPALGLFFLAPLVAEYLLGNVPVGAIAGVFILAPMYGGGALLIREVARRAGRGWPTILVLALAYGVLQPTLIDHTMFTPPVVGGPRLPGRHVHPRA
jgi:hypothetical protein